MLGYVNVPLSQAIRRLESVAPHDGTMLSDDYSAVCWDINQRSKDSWQQVVSAFKKSDGRLKSRILDALYTYGAPPKSPALIKLAVNSSNMALRFQAVGCLVGFGYGSHLRPASEDYFAEREILVQALADRNVDIREVAVRKVPYFRWDSNIERAVMRLRYDPNYVVRFEALLDYHRMTKPSKPISWDIDFLHYPGCESWRGHLSRPWNSSGIYPDVDDIEASIATLPSWEKPPFVEALTKGSLNTRLTCLDVLYRAKDPDRTKIALLVIRDPDARVRQAAYNCLAAGRLPRNIPLLLNGLKDSDETVKEQVRSLLGRKVENSLWLEGARALLRAEPNGPYAEGLRRDIKSQEQTSN